MLVEGGNKVKKLPRYLHAGDKRERRYGSY
jgi:hypothetical protein